MLNSPEEKEIVWYKHPIAIFAIFNAVILILVLVAMMIRQVNG